LPRRPKSIGKCCKWFELMWSNLSECRDSNFSGNSVILFPSIHNFFSLLKSANSVGNTCMAFLDNRSVRRFFKWANDVGIFLMKLAETSSSVKLNVPHNCFGSLFILLSLRNSFWSDTNWSQLKLLSSTWLLGLKSSGVTERLAVDLLKITSASLSATTCWSPPLLAEWPTWKWIAAAVEAFSTPSCLLEASPCLETLLRMSFVGPTDGDFETLLGDVVSSSFSGVFSFLLPLEGEVASPLREEAGELIGVWGELVGLVWFFTVVDNLRFDFEDPFLIGVILGNSTSVETEERPKLVFAPPFNLSNGRATGRTIGTCIWIGWITWV